MWPNRKSNNNGGFPIRANVRLKSIKAIRNSYKVSVSGSLVVLRSFSRSIDPRSRLCRLDKSRSTSAFAGAAAGRGPSTQKRIASPRGRSKGSSHGTGAATWSCDASKRRPRPAGQHIYSARSWAGCPDAYGCARSVVGELKMLSESCRSILCVGYASATPGSVCWLRKGRLLATQTGSSGEDARS